jgi:hypothetical protein
MKFYSPKLLAAMTLAGVALVTVGPAQAMSMKECSAKYKEAQAAGTLNGMKWNDFRKAQCKGDAAPAADAAKAETAAPAAEAGKTEAAAPTSDPAAAGDAVFPTAIGEKYASEKPGKARMHTCLDQYNANKAGNGNGGMKWIQKGGGYYSECVKRLK